MAVANTDVTECLTLIKGELTRGKKSGMSEKDQYEYAKKKGRNHPNLNFEGENTTHCRDTKTNTSRNFNAKSFLEKKLPPCVCEQLSPKELEGLSQIMNESAGIGGLSTLFYYNKTDFRQVTEFSVVEHVGQEDSEIRVHYIKITANAECSRVLFFTDCKMEINGEHRVSTFTVKNATLQEEHQRRHDSAVQRSLEFLGHRDGLKALRM